MRETWEPVETQIGIIGVIPPNPKTTTGVVRLFVSKSLNQKAKDELIKPAADGLLGVTSATYYQQGGYLAVFTEGVDAESSESYALSYVLKLKELTDELDKWQLKFYMDPSLTTAAQLERENRATHDKRELVEIVSST